MADVIAPRIDRSARDVAEKILFAREDDRELGKVIFLIGAGCSISAGVPGAVEIGRRMTREVARRLGRGSPGDDAETAYRALVRDEFLSPAEGPAGGIDWYRVYDEMFRRHYAAPDDSRALFGAVVEEAKGAINWAHLCLGELVARRLVSTVLTTNFDQLVLSGMVRAGILPVICDGVESLNRIAGAPRHPQLVELHGSRHTYLLRNRPEDVRDVWHNPQASAAVQKLLQHATTFVVVGYGGREDGVMDLLVQAAAVYRDKNLFWVQHSPDPRTLSPKAQAFLATSRNGGLLVGQDADGFFLDLCRALGVGVPSALSDPLKAVGRLIADLDAYRSPNADIRAEIDRARARHAFLHERLEDAAADTTEVEQIRELRLAGHDAEAYARAERALVTVGDLTEAPIELLKEAAGAALAFGRSSPDAAPLRQAVAYLRQLARRGGSSGTDERPPVAIPLAEAPHQAAAAAIEADAAPERAALQRQLGLALTSLGERESETARLEEAVATFRATLTERMRGQAPLDWASNQNSLGIALARLGERESGTARLEEAVAAFRAALEERTRERAPLDWAETQNNLGNALKSLSERESGTVRLEEAVAAFRAALEERTRERAPLDWAMTQNNLGNALAALGGRENGTARLEEAVAAYRAALEERTRERVPLQWATTQNNLGAALRSLGERESGTAPLEEALAACRAALEVWTRERVPLRWAMTQNNLGAALAALGERESGTARLEEAVAAYRAALEERMRERAPLDWAETQNNLGNALTRLGERESGTVRLEEAVAAFRAAQEELTADRAPTYAEMVRRNSDHASRLIQARTDPAAGEDEP